jgi:hypothetical protein
LESAQRAYDGLHGKDTVARTGKKGESTNIGRLGVDIAGMSLSSELPTSENGRLGGGQHTSNATVGEESIVSIYTMSQLYPEDDYSYVR